jgi:hypothetical protein
VLRTLTLTACAFALVACSTTSSSKPKSCDGNARRAVNIYGSILPGSPMPATTASVPAPPAPGPNGKPAKPGKSTTAPPKVPGVVPKTPTGGPARPALKPRRVSALTAAFPSCDQEGRG